MKPLFFTAIAAVAVSLSIATFAQAADAAPRKKIAVLVFDGAEVIYYAGPYEVFGDPGRFDLYTVAPTDATVTTGAGLKVDANYSLASAPQADVLIIPGGMVAKVSQDPAVLDWIKTQSAHTEITMSVCNGAFILANTGALAGLTATTTRGNIDALRKAHPEITVVRDRRFVDNGHYITTGGVSAGIDGALHVQSRLFGKGYAQANALYLEYQAHGERDYAPATFAVSAIPQPDPQVLLALGDWSFNSTDGDARHWRQVAEVKTSLDEAELRRRLEEAYSTTGKWRLIKTGDRSASHWAFVDPDGRSWTSILELKPSSEAKGSFVFAVSVRQG